MIAGGEASIEKIPIKETKNNSDFKNESFASE